MVEVRLPGRTVDEFVAAVRETAAALSRDDDGKGISTTVGVTVVRGAGDRIARVDLDVAESTSWRVESGHDAQVQVTRQTGRTRLLAWPDGDTLCVQARYSGPSRLSILSEVLSGLRDTWPGTAGDVGLVRAWLDAVQEETPEPADFAPVGGDGLGEPAGRPADAAYDWAWAEVRGGRDEGEVYEEWRRRSDVRDRWEQMEDPREAFRSAMKRRKRRGTKPT